MTYLEFAVGSLVTYRLALMFSKENGPGRIFQKLRRLPPPKSATKEGLECVHCTSVWFAAPAAAFYSAFNKITWYEFPMFWAGFSAMAVILHRLFTKDFKR